MIGILSGIAIPSLTNLAPNYRLKAAVRELYSDMQNAKIEAIKTNTNATILFQPGTYSPAGQVGSYQISIDSNGNGSYDVGETILAQKSMPQNVSLISATFIGNTAGFTPRGLSLEVISRNVQLRNNQSRFYRITLSPAGALRIHKSSDGINWN
nr:GspH/FimT family protein [Desulfobacter sp.]